MRTNSRLTEVAEGIERALAGELPFYRILLENGETLGVFHFAPPLHQPPEEAWWFKHIICQNPWLLPEELQIRACLHHYIGVVEVKLEVSFDKKTIIRAQKALLIS